MAKKKRKWTSWSKQMREKVKADTRAVRAFGRLREQLNVIAADAHQQDPRPRLVENPSTGERDGEGKV